MRRQGSEADGRYGRREALWLHHAWEAALRSAGLASFDALMNVEGTRTLDKAGLGEGRQRTELTLDGCRLYLKRYDESLGASGIISRLHHSRSPAYAEWQRVRAVEAAGVRVPEVVAFGQRRGSRRTRQSLLLFASAAGWSLEQWARDWPDRLREPQRKDAASRALADAVATLHNAGLFHRDLYLSHIFACARSDGTFDITLIDLARVIRPRVAKPRWRVKDLAALHYSTPEGVASAVDRVRWYKRYRGIARLSGWDRWLVKWVDWKARRIARHTDRHGLAINEAKSSDHRAARRI